MISFIRRLTVYPSRGVDLHPYVAVYVHEDLVHEIEVFAVDLVQALDQAAQIPVIIGGKSVKPIAIYARWTEEGG